LIPTVFLIRHRILDNSNNKNTHSKQITMFSTCNVHCRHFGSNVC